MVVSDLSQIGPLPLPGSPIISEADGRRIALLQEQEKLRVGAFIFGPNDEPIVDHEVTMFQAAPFAIPTPIAKAVTDDSGFASFKDTGVPGFFRVTVGDETKTAKIDRLSPATIRFSELPGAKFPLTALLGGVAAISVITLAIIILR